jgi:hypothetical protein
LSSTKPESPGQASPDSGEAKSASSSETRRAAVQRLGKFAAYTAPALIAMLSGTTTARACG